MSDIACWPPEHIAAGVALYHPRGETTRVVKALSEQFDGAFVAENESTVFESGGDGNNRAVHVRRNRENASLARAINQLCEAARQTGYDWSVLFDQGSQVPPAFSARFARIFAKLAEPPALLAENYRTDLCGEAFLGSRLGVDVTIGEQVTDLNAGSLISLEIHQELRVRCKALFVDHVDREYCLRMRRHACPILPTREPLFAHEVGNIVCGRRFGKVWQSGGHSTARRREATEALVRVIKSYWRDEPGWCVRMRFFALPRSVVAILVSGRQRAAKLTALAAELVRGIFRSQASVR